jgi:hypothetical protein
MNRQRMQGLAVGVLMTGLATQFKLDTSQVPGLSGWSTASERTARTYQAFATSLRAWSSVWVAACPSMAIAATVAVKRRLFGAYGPEPCFAFRHGLRLDRPDDCTTAILV